MLQPALITNIDYIKRTCDLYLTDEMGTADAEPAIITGAVFAECPGVNNGYQIGDKVWVGFIRGAKHDPVVLGLIEAPIGNATSAISGKSLEVLDKASLPVTTGFTGADKDYNTLTKLIHKLKAATNFIESHAGISKPTPETPVTPSASTLTDTIITSCPTDTDFSEFKQGTVLFVQDQLGKSLMLGAKTKVYAVNTKFNDTQKTIIEFSNAYTTTEVPGEWYVVALFDGGCLVQYKDRNINTTIPKTVKLFDDDTPYDLFDDSGNALSYYYELEEGAPGNGFVLKSVRSDTLCFYNKDNIQLTSRDPKQAIYKITLNDEDKTPLIQWFQNPADRARNIVAILNLNFNSEILRKHHFVGYNSVTVGIFGSGASINTSLQYLYLPDDYNLNYEILNVWNGQTHFSDVNRGICSGSKAIQNIYIPTNAGIIRKEAFADAGLTRFQNNKNTFTVAITNLENSAVTYIDEYAFSKVNIKDSILKLPYDPINNRVTFGLSCFNINDGIKPISTIIAHSQLDFDHNLNGDKHSGCFNYYGKFVNDRTFELVFENTKNKTFDKATVLDYLHPNNSSIKSFLRTKALLDTVDTDTFNDSVTDEAIIQMLEAVNAQVSSDFTYSMPVGETTLQVRFIDRSKKTNYYLGSATIPTIIYNY